MKMKPKMLLGSAAMSVGAVLLTTIGIVLVVGNLTRSSLEAEVTNRLILQRDMQKDQIENYMAAVSAEVTESANLDGVFTKALMDFKKPFFNFQRQTPRKKETYYSNVADYYTQQFETQYKQRNDSEPTPVANVMAKLNENSLALQNYYIAENPSPLGKKNELSKPAQTAAEYDKIHANYHPQFNDYLNKWGFYDVFLVDAESGFVIYSVFKELDFATSLRDGAYAESGLGEAYQQALTKQAGEHAYTTHMQPYYPSYNDYAAFVSAPLYVNGQLEGVFIIQMPLDKINQVMTFEQRWKDYGLGDSGETYIVADDFTMRNDSRFLIEDKTNYFTALKKADLPPQMINSITKKGTTIGLQVVKSPGSIAALQGETGFKVVPDYRNIPVLSAYAPLQVAGLNWAILAEIDEAEAFASVDALIFDIIETAVLVGLALVLISTIISLFFVNTVVKPITYLKDVIDRFKAGEEDARVHSRADDEIGELATAFDNLLDERAQSLEQITLENDQLNESVINMLQVSMQLSQGDMTAKMTVTEDVTGPLADSLNLVTDQTGKTLTQVKQTAVDVEQSANTVKQKSDTVIQVSQEEFDVVNNTVAQLAEASRALGNIVALAQQCNEAADETIATTDKAQQTVTDSIHGINSIRENISETEKRIKRLSERSQEIAGVTNIINGIAEKTHVLALNASMQAASAGEAGRGFAVVATEIQRLAENASDATVEIGALIKNIQVDTADTITTMNKAISQVVDGTRMAESAGAQMEETRGKSHELVKLVQQIAHNSENQASMSLLLQKQAEEIQQSNTQTAKQLAEQSQETNKLVDFSSRLLNAISAFKLPA